MLIPTGFWSYTTSDETSARGKLSQLRALLAAELQQQVGREPKVNIFQDVVAIPPGEEWDAQIRKAIGDSSFIIPIITPGFLQSEWCCREVMLFRQREAELGVKNLVFPLHYVSVDHVTGGDARQCHDPNVLAFLRTRQWTDFRSLRLRNQEGEEVAILLESLAQGILRALREASAEQERAAAQRQQDEAEAAQRAEDRRKAEAVLRRAEEARAAREREITIQRAREEEERQRRQVDTARQAEQERAASTRHQDEVSVTQREEEEHRADEARAAREREKPALCDPLDEQRQRQDLKRLAQAERVAVKQRQDDAGSAKRLEEQRRLEQAWATRERKWAVRERESAARRARAEEHLWTDEKAPRFAGEENTLELPPVISLVNQLQNYETYVSILKIALRDHYFRACMTISGIFFFCIILIILLKK